MISFQTLLSYGSYLVVVLLLVDKFFNGANKTRKEVIETYKERNLQLEEANKQQKISHENDRKDLQSQITSLSERLAKITGTMEEKDKLIKTLNETILNRNPALEETLASIRTFLELIYKQGTLLATKTDEQTIMIKSQGKN